METRVFRVLLSVTEFFYAVLDHSAEGYTGYHSMKKVHLYHPNVKTVVPVEWADFEKEVAYWLTIRD